MKSEVRNQCKNCKLGCMFTAALGRKTQGLIFLIFILRLKSDLNQVDFNHATLAQLPAILVEIVCGAKH